MNFKEMSGYYRALKESGGGLFPDIERTASELLAMFNETTSETMLQELADQTEGSHELTPAIIFIKRGDLWFKFDQLGDKLELDGKRFKPTDYNLRPKSVNAAFVLSSFKWNLSENEERPTSHQICLQLTSENKNVQLEVFAAKKARIDSFCNFPMYRHFSFSCMDAEDSQQLRESLGIYIVKAGVDSGLKF